MSQFIDITLIVFTVGYFIEFLWLRIGMKRATDVPIKGEYEPTVSIIVAARNEEHFIEQCLKSLTNVEYPLEKLEIIAVNDHSTDKTGEIMARLQSHFPQLHSVITNHEKENLRGKTNAVTTGIDNSKGEILMFTDADCTVPRTWVKDTVKYFTPETGIVGGFTLLNSRGTFEEVQTLDWIVLFGIASSTAGWNIPLTAIGNNLSVRRAAYDETGGYAEIPFSVTEDYALVQAILQKTKYRIRFPLDPLTAVVSNPCKSWHQLFHQKQRWGVGGLDMVTRGLVIMGIGWILKFVLIVGLFAATPAVWLGALVLKIATDIFYLWRPLSELKARKYLRSILFFEVYYILYVIAIPIVAMLSKKVVWKERSL